MGPPLRLALLDSRFEVHGEATVLAALEGLYPPTTRPRAHSETPHVVQAGPDAVSVDGTPRHEQLPPARLVEATLMTLNAVVIDDLRSFAVHAGVVSTPAGVAVAWPGVSGAGKSTLTAACVQAGWRYVSDEALVLEAERVRRYLKPVNLSPWSLSRLALQGAQPGLAERAVGVDELGACAEGEVALGHLVHLRRRSGRPSLSPAAGAASAMLLLDHSFNHYRMPRAAFEQATRAAAAARCWTLEYDDPAEAAALLTERLGRAGPRL